MAAAASAACGFKEDRRVKRQEFRTRLIRLTSIFVRPLGQCQCMQHVSWGLHVLLVLANDCGSSKHPSAVLGLRAALCGARWGLRVAVMLSVHSPACLTSCCKILHTLYVQDTISGPQTIDLPKSEELLDKLLRNLRQERCGRLGSCSWLRSSHFSTAEPAVACSCTCVCLQPP